MTARLRKSHVEYEVDGEPCLRLDKSDYSTFTSMFDMFRAWQQEAAKPEHGEITKEEYDQWRYNYPKFDTSQHWVHLPSQELSDMIVEEFKRESKRKNRHKIGLDKLYWRKHYG